MGDNQSRQKRPKTAHWIFGNHDQEALDIKKNLIIMNYEELCVWCLYFVPDELLISEYSTNIRICYFFEIKRCCLLFFFYSSCTD